MKNLDNVKKMFEKNRYKRIFWECIVVEHDNCFYKTPNYTWKMVHSWKDKYKCVVNSVDLIKKYFSKICKITETEITKNDECHYIIKQKKIHGDILKFSDFKNEIIRKKMTEILKINKQLWKKEWYFLDLFWTDVFFKLKVSNLILYKNDIYIFDFWLLNKNSKNYFFRFLSYIFYYLQIFLLDILIRFLKS